jgi:hypothetical protein
MKPPQAEISDQPNTSDRSDTVYRPPRWASKPLHTSATNFFASLRSAFPVSLIATPREQLQSRLAREADRITDDPLLNDFDHVPLTDHEGSIVAVFVRNRGRLDLREDMFMTADTPLLSYLETADKRPFCFLLSDSVISGLVTLSDIQKLPVYSILFSLSIAVEMLLMELIRKSCGANSDAWFELLDESQKGTINKHWDDARKRNLAIDKLYHASLSHEIKAALKLGLFEHDSDEHRQFSDLVDLRNTICHAAEVAPNLEEARKIPARVNNAQNLAKWLQSQLESTAPGPNGSLSRHG